MDEDILDSAAITASHSHLVDALAQTAFAVTAVLTKVGAEQDLSLTQLRVLAILRGRRLRMSGLAAYLGLEKSTLSGLVDRAEKRGLVARSANESDGRATDVQLTQRGSDLAGEVFAQVTRSLTPLTETLAPRDQERLRGLLMAMLGAQPGVR